MLAISTGITALFSISPGVGFQVFASNSNDENDDEDNDSNDESDNGESGDSSDSGDNGIGGGGGFSTIPSSSFDPKASDPSGVIIPANENSSTYENKEHGFAFDFPADWQRARPTTQDGILNVRVEAPDSGSDSTSLGDFEVDVYTTKGYLDPSTMEIKNGTAQGYATSDIQTLEGMATYPSNKLDMRFDISKSQPISIAGKGDAWRIEYVGSLMGSQVSFNVKGYVLASDGKLYKLKFSTAALEAPKTLPIGEKIIESFRFT